MDAAIIEFCKIAPSANFWHAQKQFFLKTQLRPMGH